MFSECVAIGNDDANEDDIEREHFLRPVIVIVNLKEEPVNGVNESCNLKDEREKDEKDSWHFPKSSR